MLAILCVQKVLRKLPSMYVFSYFPFGFGGRMWDLIVSVPDHCLSFYFDAGLLGFLTAVLGLASKLMLRAVWGVLTC